MTGDADYKGTAVISTNSGNSLYFALSSEAVVDGKTVNIDISQFVSVDFAESVKATLLKSFLEASTIGSDFETKVVTVSFPAGAASIQYDPTIGNGQLPYSSAATVSALIALLSLLVLLF